MKQISISELELINGGNALDFVCGGVDATAVVLLAAKVALGPIGTAVSAGCAVYEVGRVFSWW